jgi:hypothetical protein
VKRGWIFRLAKRDLSSSVPPATSFDIGIGPRVDSASISPPMSVATRRPLGSAPTNQTPLRPKVEEEEGSVPA